MMKRGKHAARALLTPLLLLACADAAAQAGAPAPPDERDLRPRDPVELDAVVATGTHLRRIDAEGPLPVIVIDAVELERQGALTLADALRQLPYNSFGITGGDPLEHANASLPNLRGLGSKYTLTLLDGRRLPGHPNFNGAAAASISGIPMAAIARVEVLRDGASAIYGSDAIGGVINLITHKGEQQPQFGVHWEQPDGPGGDAWSMHLVDGGTSARAQWLVTLERTHRDAIAGADRQYLLDNAPLSTQGNPGSILRFVPGTFSLVGPVQPDPRCPDTVDASDVYPDSGLLGDRDDGFCGYRYRTLNYERDALDNLALFASGRHDFGAQVTGFARALVTDTDSLIQGAPSPVFAASIASDNPINPTRGEFAPGLGYDLLLRYRLTSLGPRQMEAEDAGRHLLAGVEGNAAWLGGGTWSVDAYLNLHDRDMLGRRGYALLAPFNDAVASGRFNPFTALPNDASGLEDAIYQPRFHSQSRTHGMHADITFDALGLPGGRVAWAFGAEARRDRYAVDDDPQAVAGQVIGVEGSHQRAQRDYAGVYGEALLPLGRAWQADVAVRYDRYQSAGAATSPKLALAWRPSPRWLLRGSWGRGFQAPDLESAYASPVLSGDFFVDERACAIRPGDPVACEPHAWDTVLVSNPRLAPERALQQNAGMVWQPLPTLGFVIDYYRVRISDQIMFLTGPQVARNDLRCFQEQRACDPLQEGAIERDANGDIVRVIVPRVNIAEYRTEGVDIEVNWHPRTRLGMFEISLRASGVLEAELQPFADSPPSDQLGLFGHPRWRATAAADWRRDRHSLGFRVNHIAGQHACFDYLQQDGSPDPECAQRIGSHTELDAYWTWEAPWQARITLGARNLADRRIPLVPAGAAFAGAFSYGLYDPTGRVFYLRYVQTF